MQKILTLIDTFRMRLPTNSHLISRAYNTLKQQEINLLYKTNIIPAIRKESRKNRVIVYSMDEEATRKLSLKGIDAIRPKEFLSKNEYKQIDEECMEFIRGFPSKNKGIGEIFEYCGISLWDFVQFDTWSYLKRKWGLLETAKKIIEREMPDKIIIFDRNSDIGKICTILAKHMKIEIIDRTYFISGIRHFMKSNFSGFMYNLTKPWGIGKLKLRKQIKIKGPVDKKDIIIFGNHLFPSKLLTPWLGKLKKGKNLLFVSFTPMEQVRKLNIENARFSSLTDYSNEEIIKRVREKTRELKGFWRRFRKAQKSRKEVRYKSIDIYPLLEDILDYYFRYDFKEIAKYIELIKNAFFIERPSINIVYDEISRNSKCINYAAKTTGIPTILIQHGALVDYPLYGDFYADIFAVYGENTKKKYEKIGIKSSKIKIIGNIKFDEFYKEKKAYSKEKILRKITIAKGKRIVLFTSQPLPKDEIEPIIFEIFREFSKLPQEKYHLVIKLHPAEDGRLHANIAKNFSNYTLIKEGNIFEIINASDAVITAWSTTGLEAMLLGKPVIMINLSSVPDKVDYAKEGAALGVYSEGKLAGAILKSMDDQKTRARLFKEQKKFVYKEAYKVDGRAAERLIKIMQDMMRK